MILFRDHLRKLKKLVWLSSGGCKGGGGSSQSIKALERKVFWDILRGVSMGDFRLGRT